MYTTGLTILYKGLKDAASITTTNALFPKARISVNEQPSVSHSRKQPNVYGAQNLTDGGKSQERRQSTEFAEKYGGASQASCGTYLQLTNITTQYATCEMFAR